MEGTYMKRTILLPLLAALALRLLVWQWREFYPLGGDEREYLAQAITLLQTHRYSELRFMRPPIYSLMLASWVFLFDSLIQNLRLVQAIISAATVVPLFLMAQEASVVPPSGAQPNPAPPQTPARIIAWCAALHYTFAAYATELLTETLFLAGLSLHLWLLLRAIRTKSRGTTIGAGLTLGALCLIRSVALPLLPLGLIGLGLAWGRTGRKVPWPTTLTTIVTGSLPFLLATLAVISPWTVRNTITYGGLILIDTTGAENLWLDNDPAGRDPIKAQLYAMGDDRLARQRLASTRGFAVIRADPVAFARKAWRELTRFFALEQSDGLRERPAIWVPPADVAARLILGDLLWLIMLLVGSYGLARAPAPIALLAIPWALYILLTGALFHVELRYRLPIYPALLLGIVCTLSPWAPTTPRWRKRLPLLAPIVMLGFTLLHAPYPQRAWQLGTKHLALAQADAALARGAADDAERAAQRALASDDGSALAHVALARAALLRGATNEAEIHLRNAIAVIPAQPHAHLLLGDLQRQAGNPEAARRELAYETGSLEDLQAWCRTRCTTPPPAQLTIGNGLDLGFIEGFYPAEADGWRWSRAIARITLASPTPRSLHLRLASGRPAAAPNPTVTISSGGRTIGQLSVVPGWHDYTLLLPTTPSGPLTIELRSDTFTPRTYDRTSADGRELGVMTARVELKK